MITSPVNPKDARIFMEDLLSDVRDLCKGLDLEVEFFKGGIDILLTNGKPLISSIRTDFTDTEIFVKFYINRFQNICYILLDPKDMYASVPKILETLARIIENPEAAEYIKGLL